MNICLQKRTLLLLYQEITCSNITWIGFYILRKDGANILF